MWNLLKKLPIVLALAVISGPVSAQDPSAAPAAAGGEVRVGLYGSLTGSEATFGKDTEAGVLLAIKEANIAGGVAVAGGPKQTLKLISMDDQGKAEEVQSVVNNLITKEKVHVVIGEVASTLSLAAAPICQKAGIPMISPSSTNPRVTEVGDFIFRVCFIDPFQGLVMAKFAKNTLQATTAGLFVDNGSDYAKGLAQYFANTFKQMGGEIVSEQYYGNKDMDFKSQLTEYKNKNPDVLFVPGYYTQVGQIAQQARDLGLSAIFLGGDGWDSTKLTEIGGEAIHGAYYSNHYHAKEDRAEVKQFVEAYQKEYGVVPTGLAALGYDAARLALDAMTRAKSINGADLRDAIAASKDFPGVTGKITINKERNADKSAIVLQVTGEGFEPVETISPQ